MSEELPVVLAMTGASGARYGLRLLECLLDAERTVYLMVSKAAQVVISTETDLALPGGTRAMQDCLCRRYQVRSGQLQVFGREQWTAPVASGSARLGAMVICPASTGTLSAVASGACDNLIERAADVCLKERRKLLLVPRETPYSEIHLENMLRLSRMGAVVLPASPGFYHRPHTIEELIDFVVARILDQLAIPQQLCRRWGDNPAADSV